MVPRARTSAGSNGFGAGYATSIRIKRLISLWALVPTGASVTQTWSLAARVVKA
jgi:hypothetical protein